MREQQRPDATAPEREQLLARQRSRPRVVCLSTSDRDRKQLLRCLIEEVILDVASEQRRATVTIRRRGGAITELAVALPKPQRGLHTDEDILQLLPRLAAHYDDATIAGIHRCCCCSATGERFTQNHRQRAASLPQHPNLQATRHTTRR